MLSRLLIWIAPVLLATLLLVIAKGFKMETQLPRQLIASLEADVEMKGIRFYHHEDGRLRLMLRSSRCLYYDKAGELELEGVNSTLIGADGREVRVTADKGSYSLNEARILLKGHVLLETKEGDLLKTSSLVMDHKNMVMSSDSPVVFERSGLLLKGKGFRYDFEQGKLVIDQQESVIKGGDFPG